MTIQFPDFAETALEAFAACSVVDKSMETNEWPDRPKSKVARLSPQSDVMVRLYVNRQDDPDGLHVHVAMVRERVFKTVPKTNSSISEISDCLNNLCSGASLLVRPKVQLVVERANLPQKGIISILSGFGGEESSVRLTGATLEFKRFGNTSLNWRTRTKEGDPEKIEIEIESARTVQFSEDYLLASIRPLLRTFDVFVVEDLAGAAREP